MTGAIGSAGATTITLRPATEDELPICAGIWRESINDYLLPMRQPEIPDDLAAITRLYRHLRSTDPDRFVVAVEGGAIIAFGSAVVRRPLWFLSMLFVRPEAQGRGLGRTLLGRLLPDPSEGLTLGTATDAVQPISNGLYASLGIPPRMPIYNVIGRPEHANAFPPLPAGVSAAAFDDVSPDDEERRLGVGGEIDALDLELAGFAHAQDHRWVRVEGRRGWAYRSADGRLLGYGYASEVGRVGPVAVRDADLLAPVLGHLLGAVQPRGASAIWLPGDAGEAMVAALRSGMRLEGFPLLLCWSRPFADFGRYLPISPGLL